MKRTSLSLDRQRNLGIIAHIDAGKTTLTERLLWKTGTLHRVGEVHNGNTVKDHMDLVRERGITIGSAATQAMWHSDRHDEHRLTLIDTPGHIDFSIEVERSLRVLDGAVAVFCAVGGVQPQSETVWRQARRHGVPVMAFVNKMDRTGADFHRVVEQIRTRLRANPVVVALPIGAEHAYEGSLDLLTRQAWVWDDAGMLNIRPWTSEEEERAVPYRTTLVEAIVETDDALLDAYVSGHAIDDHVLRRALRQATLDRRLVPVVSGSAFKNKGIELLLDAIVDYLPSPADRPALQAHADDGVQEVHADPKGLVAGLVFKVVEQLHGSQAFVRLYRGQLRSGDQVLNASQGVSMRVGRLGVVMADQTQDVDHAVAGDIVSIFGWKDVHTGDTITDPKHPLLRETITTNEPVLAWRLSPSRSDDLGKLSSGLEKLTREDPSLRVGVDSQTGETVLWGMGELHLDVTIERLRREYGVQLHVGHPMVAYQETISGPSGLVDGVVSKQTGGKGQFAKVSISVAPRADGLVVFEDQVKGGAVPREFVQATEKGIKDALGEGLKGYPVVGVTVVLHDGQTHAVDSSAQAFQRAGAQAIKDALIRVGTVLLEPVMAVRVETPAEYVGDVLGDLQKRLGQLQGVAEEDTHAQVTALVPLAQLVGYATALRSLSQGRASASLELDGYRPQLETAAARLKR